MKGLKLLSILLAVVIAMSLFAGCKSSKGDTPDGTPDIAEPEVTSPDEEDNYEEGVSDTDNIVNTAAAEKVILVVSFGTSYNQARDLNIGAIETAIQNAYPDYQVRRAFTSQIIIDKLASRENLKIDNVTEAMDRLVLDKVKEVVVLPTTVMNGFEYDDMMAEIAPYTDKFEILKTGKHLLADDADYDKVAQLLVTETSALRGEDTAIVFMGHGTEHEAGETYTKLQNVLNAKGYNDYVIGTVEHGIELEDVQKILSGMEVKKVVLRPLMVVAGDHANNDMAGDDEDSWKTVLKEDGYTVETVLEGLGQIKGIRDIYINHVKDAVESDSISVTPTAAAVGVTANRIKNGTYLIEADTDTSMFRITDCQLTVNDESMTAKITLSGQGYESIYMGKAERALSDEENQYKFTLADGKHSFMVPIEALDRDTDCAALGAKSGRWFDHTVVFKSDNLTSDAFASKQINAQMSGGSGKAGIESPAALLYKEGQNTVQIVWSSPHYTYMLVDGVKYLPVNTEGNSTFEIPVKLDADMRVIACTAAMSSPKEIEYTLYFDSSTVK